MGFIEAVKTAWWDKKFDFRGRACRSEYWWFALSIFVFFVPIIMLVTIVSTVLGNFYPHADLPFHFFITSFLVLFFVSRIPWLAVSVRRLHDADISGWWCLCYVFLWLPPISVVALIAWLIFACTKGTEGANRFGADPLGKSGNEGMPAKADDIPFKNIPWNLKN